MALSNATHGAPGKAHGAGRGAPVTGLEFLTAEGSDILVPAATGKDGVDFSALMQGIIQPTAKAEAATAASTVPAVGPEADVTAITLTLPVAPREANGAAVVPPSPVVSSKAEGPKVGNSTPEDAVALLAVALGDAGASAAPPSQGVVTVPQGAKQPDALLREVIEKEPRADADGKTASLNLALHHAAEKGAERRAAASAKKLPNPAFHEHKSDKTRNPEAEAKTADTAPSATVPDPRAQSINRSNVSIQGRSAPVIVPARAASGYENLDGSRPSDGRAMKEVLKTADGTSGAQQTTVAALPKQDRGEKAPVAEAPAEASMLERIAGNEKPDIKSKESVITVSELKRNIGGSQSDQLAVNGPKESPHSRERAATERADAPPARLEVAADAPRVEGASQPLPAPISSAAPPSVQPTSNLSVGGSLGQQVVDMGVSGQWIEDVARQIASIAANPGHGSFRIASHELGAVRVDIAPSAIGNGSDILMRVDNDAAFAALSDDKDRLMQDARMASVRIGELRIDRVPSPQEAARGDMSGNSQQQQNSATQQQGNPSSPAQTSAQMGGNGSHQQGRQDAAALAGQNQGGQNPKAPFTTTVMRDGQADEAAGSMRSGRGDSARYA